MRVDLHNHTARCKHANGSMESYILRAIELGIDVFGFSCHAPLKSGWDREYRMEYDELKYYIDDVLSLKQKYSKQIQILLALEADFLAHRDDLIYKDLYDLELDYLIGSVHFLDDWGFDNPVFIREYSKRDKKQTWREYLKTIALMAESGYYQIVGHFDLLKIFNYQPPEEVIEDILETLKVIKKSGMAIEVNASGLRKPVQEQYPSREIIELAYKLDVPIAFGSDAHEINHIGFGYDQCVKIVREIGYQKVVYFENKQMKSVVF